MKEDKKSKVLVLVGPTASGKTALSVALAKALNGEIISADSMQIYKYMKIGTAKVKQSEMEGIPHHLVDFVLPDDEYSVAKFKDDALKCIEEIIKRGKIPIIVGGTGLYINGLTLPWSFREKDEDEEIRWRLAAEAEMLGVEALHQRLKEIDPETAKIVHPNNVKRVIRALEIFETTGKPKSYFDKKASTDEMPYDYELIGLYWPREILYQRINQRVDQMIDDGLIEETEDLLDRGYEWSLTALQAIGYKELKPYLNGEVSKEEACDRLRRDTRHFAKRQLTWFRKDKRIHWIDMDLDLNQETIVNECIKIFENK
jgi:tRNA dimethylallyltransferase